MMSLLVWPREVLSFLSAITMSALVHLVNTIILDFFCTSAYAVAMTETVDELIDKLRPATLADIAEQCGLSLRALMKLRAGEIDKPRRATVIAMAAALGCKQSRVRAAIAASFAAGRG
jgi:hypothetical protein